MRRRLAATALGLLAAAALAPLASAHDAHRIEWRGVEGSPPLKDGDSVYEKDFVAIEAMFSYDIASWRIEMAPEGGGDTAFCAGGEASGPTPDFQCNWDTRHLGDMTSLKPGEGLSGGKPSPNGSYLVTATVWTADNCNLIGCYGDPQPHVKGPIRVTVTNDLVKPATPVARSENGTIFVEFLRNPEPDAVTVLQERVNGGAWADKTTDTHFQQAGAPGVYEYRVVANRPHSSQVESDATPAFEVAAPPPGPAPTDPGTVGPAPGPPPTSGTTATTARPKTGTTTRPRSTESARGLGGSNLFSRPTVRQSPPSTTVTTVDDGFQEQLTYPTAPPKMIEMPGDEVAIERLITEERPIDVRGMLIPLAGGLAVFVLAMQMIFMARRRPSIATGSEDDWA